VKNESQRETENRSVWYSDRSHCMWGAAHYRTRRGIPSDSRGLLAQAQHLAAWRAEGDFL
jgi:hypothetical protein